MSGRADDPTLTLEDDARRLLHRLGMPDALCLTAGDVVELANLFRRVYAAELKAEALRETVERLALERDNALATWRNPLWWENAQDKTCRACGHAAHEPGGCIHQTPACLCIGWMRTARQV